MTQEQLKQLIELTEQFKSEIKKDCCGYVWRCGESMGKALASDFIVMVDSQLRFNEGK